MNRRIAALCSAVLVVVACGDAGLPEASTTLTSTTLMSTTLTSTSTTSVEPATAAPWPAAEWPKSTPEEQGMDSAKLVDLIDRVVATSGIDSVMVLRNGYVVLDAVVYPFGWDDPHIVHSVTKSVVATLIGMAIDQGLLAGVDQPVVDVLAGAAPEIVDERKADMTVADLLTMTTGLDCRDSYLYEWQGMREMQQSDDWTAHVLALPMRDEPGTRFEYCNGSSFLLSAILTEVTGMPASEYAQQKLFGPLAFGGFEWPASPDGTTLGWGELWLHPVDMAKLGYLYLRDGEWDGTQLVPTEWIEAATTEHIAAATLSDGYGYQWWISDEGYTMALGFGGQYVLVDPAHQLVVVFTSGLRGGQFGVPEDFVTRYVIPAVVSDTPLPANPDSNARLSAAVEEAAASPEPAPVSLSELHSTMQGARFEFVASELSPAPFGLRFAHDAAFFRLDDGGEPFELRIGLDGRFAVDDSIPVALRGSWSAEDTFVIEFQIIGGVERGVFRFQFAGDAADVTYVENVTGIFGQTTADRVD